MKSEDFKPSIELKTITERWLLSSSRRDTKAIVNLLSTSQALTYFGSAENEIFTADKLRLSFASIPDALPVFVYENVQISAYENGPVDWSFWYATMFTPETCNRVEFRGALVFGLESAVWRIVHSHNSSPITNVLTMGYDPDTFYDLINAAAQAMPDIGREGMVSVMFTDIAGSTALAQAMGDNGWNAVLQRHMSMLCGIIADSDGTFVKSLGDGSMSTYPTARAALAAAQSMQTAIAGEQCEPQLRARIGIHTGDVVENNGDFFGTVVNKAARVTANNN
jgi:adenylate cyclase